MDTLITEDPKKAARFIRSGGLAAFPTETVYGLGADLFDASAIAKIFVAKQRPADNPLIAHVGEKDAINEVAEDITDAARVLIDAFFPGPLTVVLRRSNRVPLIATAGLETVGVRMPRHELANKFLRACGTPVAAPSANLSGKPSPTDWKAVYEDLDGRIDCILMGEATEIGLESTVVDCTREIPVVLRAGAIPFEEIARLLPKVRRFSKDSDAARPASPGMRHKHYSPKAEVVIVASVEDAPAARNAAFIGLDAATDAFGFSLRCANAEEYARELFAFFRECDRKSIRTIFCQRVEPVGIGAALMDRLERAAER